MGSYELSAVSQERRGRSSELSAMSYGPKKTASPRCCVAASFFRRSAFSLVELLVVIGIITLLIGIALPAFARAKEAAKVASTTSTITTITTGLEALRSDEKFGGQYPPSYYLFNLVTNPHDKSNPARIQKLGGANLVAWALAGADLLGTPGFRDLNGVDGNGTGGLASWADDTKGLNYAPPDPPLGMYAFNTTNGQPGYARSTFVPVEKMHFPQRVKDASGYTNVFKIPTTTESFESIFFLDAFDQPILYYRANLGRTAMVDNAANNVCQGVYNMADNTPMYVDYGAGADHFKYTNGPWGTPGPGTPDPNVNTGYLNTFAHAVWNPSVTTSPTAYNPDGYIVLSAGPDGLFGTADDIANYPVNK